MYSARYFCPILTQIRVAGQIFVKSSTNLTDIRPVGAALIHSDGRMDGNDEAKTRFSRLCERA